ncbi:poly-beta-1,6 N-acetyl-D-glucosamine synthase [Krasilnikovia cinnamomea]|uniref:Poly-beta-1,6 N-acetyl-D-glucosamine synthase n=1 Tax=Krasilnikovia cinnamomea TaxID=349313 RepID=A0A4V2G7L3_9ACTN|nr:bifunctional polysaccharide deacetylase/glycosyltransferase family 2 protein [Krasilnikovia cinnamomea]RZU53026.1 poly-beta-1,6 N-acetyl-D-glucosamine synthase [Krasilnikovia cinnamomea]
MRRPEPRAHWALLALVLVFVLALLCLNGYVTHAGAEGTGQPVPDTAAPAAPTAVTGGAPVQRIAADGTVTTRGMPAKTIALTFDDGPDPAWTPAILDVLDRHRARATFFMLGAQINEHRDLVRRAHDEGHEIGSHTFTHVPAAHTAPWLLRAELSLTSNAIAAATGVRPVLMRPPYSSEPDAITGTDYDGLRHIADAGYLVVLADHDTDDWRRPGATAIARAATPARGAGAVVMLHDSGGDRSQTVAALDLLIPQLQREGYRFVTVSEALRLGSAPRATAGERWRGTAVRLAQRAGGWLAGAMTVLMVTAVALAAIRLAVQVWAARRHRRRIRGQQQVPRAHLGRVTVVVPAYNEAANIAETVRSLVGSDYPDLDVIVVDDGSTDGTADIVERLRLPRVHVIRQANAGKPAALNTGVRHAHGEVLILVDGDTVFAPDAVGRLIQPLRDPRVGAVSGNTKVANRGGLLGRWQHLEYVIGFNLDRRMFDIARCMPTVPGAIGAFRRAAIRDIGGVSDDTLAEDTDLTMAIIRAGWRVVYEPDAIAWTEAPATLRQLWRQRYRWCYGTMQAMWKHRRALAQRGAAGRLGRRGLSYLLLFQVLLPLSAPLVDVYGLYGLLFLPVGKAAAVWAGFTAVQVATAGYALYLDRERFGPLWSLPLQQILYRQLMYLVVVQSAVMALLGGRLRWQRMTRTGAATAHAEATARAVAPARATPYHAQVTARRLTSNHLPGPPNSRPERYPEDTMTGARWPVN